MLPLDRDTAAAAIELLAEPAAVIDADGCVLATNGPWDAFASDNGGDPATTGVGSSYLDACDAASGLFAEGANEAADGLRAVLGRRLVRFQLDYPCPDAAGVDRWYRLQVRSLRDEPVAIVSHHELRGEDREEVLGHPVATVARAADGENRAHDLFMSGVSHELRTPLTAIIGMATTLRTYWDSVDEDRKRHWLSIIESNSRRLGEVVEEFLAIARLQSGSSRAVPELVDVAALLERIVGDATDSGSRVDVSVDAGASLMASIDPAHLRLIVQNLLSNAIKYGAPPYEVAAHGTEGGVVVSVRDHGSGVPEEFREEMFERFTRAERHAASGTPGTGIGLSLVQELVALDGGRVDYEDAHPGARFVLTLADAASRDALAS